METRLLTNVTLLEKDYHLDPPLEFTIETSTEYGSVYAENEHIAISEYSTSIGEVMNQVKESFERRCRFYANPGTELTADQLAMKKVYENLNLEEGHIEEPNFTELRQLEEIFPLADKTELEFLPGKSVVNKLNDSYYKAYVDGYQDAVKIWTSVVEKLIEKLN